jgi:hypothetical protein
MINCALRLQTMKLFREKARVAALMLLIAAQGARRFDTFAATVKNKNYIYNWISVCS